MGSMSGLIAILPASEMAIIIIMGTNQSEIRCDIHLLVHEHGPSTIPTRAKSLQKY